MSVRKTALDLSAAELARRRLSRLGAELSPPADAPDHSVASDPPPSTADLRRPSWVDHPSGRWQAVEPPAAPSRSALPAAPAVAPSVPSDGRRGRHARERLSWLGRGAGRAADALPPALQGRLAITAHHVTVVALVLAAAMAVAAWIAVRSAPAAVSPPRQASLQLPAGSESPGVPAAAPTVEPVDASSPAPAVSGGAVPGGAVPGGAGAESASIGAAVFVHVIGKVRRPGVVELADGSRVIDAVEEAGGARPGVRLGTLNLARPVVDGEQIAVGVPMAAAAAPAPVGAAPTSPPVAGSTTGVPGSLVNINTADQLQLEELPGVGPVTATAIIEWRTEHGGYSTVDELLEVSGIGEITLEELRDFVTI
jgi:competence protein ComEA